MEALRDIHSILHINEKAGQFGGTEEYIVSLTKLLSPLKISSHLIYDHLHGRIPSSVESHVRISGLGDRDGSEDVAGRVLQLCMRISPEIVYVHNIFDGRVVRRLDIPNRNYTILWYIHDHYPTCLTELRARKGRSELICQDALSEACLSYVRSGYCQKRNKERTYTLRDLSHRLYLLRSTRHVDGIIVVSDFMREVLAKNLPEVQPRIHVLPRQVRNGKKNHRLRRGGMRTVVFSGRIAYEKGLHTVIKALSQVQMENKVLFRIAGPVEDPGYWSHCLMLAEDAEVNNPFLAIRYEGLLSYEKADSLYREADIAVVPSLWAEPSGTVAAEAMANGAAVLAFDVGGINTWVRHERTGLLVKPNDVAALSQGLRRLLSDHDFRNGLAARGRQLITRRFNARNHLSSLAEVIHHCRNSPTSAQ